MAEAAACSFALQFDYYKSEAQAEPSAVLTLIVNVAQRGTAN